MLLLWQQEGHPAYKNVLHNFCFGDPPCGIDPRNEKLSVTGNPRSDRPLFSYSSSDCRSVGTRFGQLVKGSDGRAFRSRLIEQESDRMRPWVTFPGWKMSVELHSALYAVG